MTSAEPRLHVETRGDGPCVLLMHGFGGSARNLRPQARALEDEYRTICFDARGHARSEAPQARGAYAAECFVRDVERVLDHAGEHEAIVGGVSMGAAIALRFALDRPSRVRALVLAAFPGDGMAEWARAFADDIERNGLEAAGARRVWGAGSRFDAESAALIRRGFLEHSASALTAILREFLAERRPVSSSAAELAAVQMPCCVIVGSEDLGSLAASRALARLLPRAELHVLEGAGHTANISSRVAFNAVLRRFLGSPS